MAQSLRQEHTVVRLLRIGKERTEGQDADRAPLHRSSHRGPTLPIWAEAGDWPRDKRRACGETLQISRATRTALLGVRPSIRSAFRRLEHPNSWESAAILPARPRSVDRQFNRRS